MCFFSIALFLIGCNFPQSTLEGHGPAASQIAGLSWLMTILFLVVSLIMWVLLGWGFAKRRGTLEEHAPIAADGGEIWIAIGGLAIPILILTVLFVVGLNLLNDFPIHGMHGAMAGMRHAKIKPEIRITGSQWWWKIEYLNDDLTQQFTTADELHIPSGRPVDIEVTTNDVMHSLWIPALHGKVDLVPGISNYIRLEASEPGTFEGQCAEFCGGQHAHMRLLTIVDDPETYAAWVQEQLKPGAEPKTPEAVAGQQVFLAGPCAMCHEVRGTIAGGRVAPDLTHIGSRKFIASNSFPNNNAYLEAWITHAQSLKPETLMPNLTQFNGTQLQDLVAYLRQLQ
jgi:cytochrome c oxidase subunit 2